MVLLDTAIKLNIVIVADVVSLVLLSIYLINLRTGMHCRCLLCGHLDSDLSLPFIGPYY